MVIIGGGEPTLYRNGKYHFQELVDEVIDQNLKITLALTTNGSIKPPGDWPNKFDWIRVSLDAATERTYKNFRGKSSFSKVVENFLSYLEYNAPYVGISFLFAKSNIHEYAKVSNFIFNLVKKKSHTTYTKSIFSIDPSGGAHTTTINRLPKPLRNSRFKLLSKM